MFNNQSLSGHLLVEIFSILSNMPCFVLVSLFHPPSIPPGLESPTPRNIPRQRLKFQEALPVFQKPLFLKTLISRNPNHKTYFKKPYLKKPYFKKTLSQKTLFQKALSQKTLFQKALFQKTLNLQPRKTRLIPYHQPPNRSCLTQEYPKLQATIFFTRTNVDTTSIQ